MKRYFFILTFLLTALSITQKAQAAMRVSLLTCDAGEDLYTIWGHTAIRIIDSANHTDIVYNYGTFNFNEPNFIAKFVKGNLRYFISADSYPNFIYEYQYFGRNVHEQILKMSEAEKLKWQEALTFNLSGDNKYYLYNFITDNCTTRIKDGLAKHVVLSDSSFGIQSFRTEVVSAPYKGGLPWIGFGIDLLLGAVSDQKPTSQQAPFLPQLLYNKVNTNPAIVLKTTHYNFNKSNPQKGIMPIYILGAILIMYIVLGFSNNKLGLKAARVLDIALLFILGIAGVLVFYMSQISMHTACHENYNLIWMHPLYLIAIPVYFISKKWTGYLGFIYFIPTVLLMFGAYWIPQHFSQTVIALMAITLTLQVRLIKKASQP